MPIHATKVNTAPTGYKWVATTIATLATQGMGFKREFLWHISMSWWGGRSMPGAVPSWSSIPCHSGCDEALSPSWWWNFCFQISVFSPRWLWWVDHWQASHCCGWYCGQHSCHPIPFSSTWPCCLLLRRYKRLISGCDACQTIGLAVLALLMPQHKKSPCVHFTSCLLLMQVNILGYVGSYYAIASAWPMTTVSVLCTKLPTLKADFTVMLT